jgi:hypothetical protein
MAADSQRERHEARIGRHRAERRIFAITERVGSSAARRRCAQLDVFRGDHLNDVPAGSAIGAANARPHTIAEPLSGVMAQDAPIAMNDAPARRIDVLRDRLPIVPPDVYLVSGKLEFSVRVYKGISPNLFQGKQRVEHNSVQLSPELMVRTLIYSG